MRISPNFECNIRLNLSWHGIECHRDAAHQEGIEEVGERVIRNSNIPSIRTSGCNAAYNRAIALQLNSAKLVMNRPKN
jgi:hypothetical protein